MGDVSAQASAIVNQYVIPWLIPIGLCFISFILNILGLAKGVGRDNGTSVTVDLMSHDKAEIIKDAG